MQAVEKDRGAIEVASSKVRRVEEVLESHKGDIPPRVYRALLSEVRGAIEASETSAESTVKQMGLLGALATAGIAAVAYEHEATKQLAELEALADDISEEVTGTNGKELVKRLTSWIRLSRDTRSLFSSLNDQENREVRRKLRAQPLLEEIWNQIAPLVGDVRFTVGDVDESLRLPPGTLAEWTAVFQNVFLNASNAMLDEEKKQIRVRSWASDDRRRLIVEDTGVGVDVENSAKLFDPFVRELEISRERRELGLGGMGMGLAIVRMVANNLGCRVSFGRPAGRFATAFELSWTEKR